MNKIVTRCYSQSKKYSPSVDIVLSFQYWYHRDEFSFDGTGGNYLIIELIKLLTNYVICLVFGKHIIYLLSGCIELYHTYP